jgi:hypothetical protein
MQLPNRIDAVRIPLFDQETSYCNVNKSSRRAIHPAVIPTTVIVGNSFMK